MLPCMNHFMYRVNAFHTNHVIGITVRKVSAYPHILYRFPTRRALFLISGYRERSSFPSLAIPDSCIFPIITVESFGQRAIRRGWPSAKISVHAAWLGLPKPVACRATSSIRFFLKSNSLIRLAGRSGSPKRKSLGK